MVYVLLVRNPYVSALCPVVLRPYLRTSDSSAFPSSAVPRHCPSAFATGALGRALLPGGAPVGRSSGGTWGGGLSDPARTFRVAPSEPTAFDRAVTLSDCLGLVSDSTRAELAQNNISTYFNKLYMFSILWQDG